MGKARVWTPVILSVVAALLVAGCAKSAAPAASQGARKSLVFATSPIGTATYVASSGLAVLVEKYAGIKVIVQPLATTPLQYNELAAGRVSMILMVQGNSYLAFRGLEEYEKVGPRSFRQLGTGNANAHVWVTRPDTGIKSVKDFVGKKVMYLSAVNQPTTDGFKLCLDFYGVADKVTALNRASMEAAAQALIEKKVDVIGGPYGAFAYQLKETTGLVVIPIDAEVVKYTAQKRPDLGAVMGTYDAGYYALPEKMSTSSRVKEMTVSPAMPEDVAYAMTKAIYDHPEDARAIHRDVGEFNLDQALSYGFFTPTHPGAVRYYKEKGVWTKEHEALQQKYLEEEKQLMAKKQ